MGRKTPVIQPVLKTAAENEEIKVVKKMLKYAKTAFGKPYCKEFYPDCAACKGNQLIGYLEWYLDMLVF